MNTSFFDVFHYHQYHRFHRHQIDIDLYRMFKEPIKQNGVFGARGKAAFTKGSKSSSSYATIMARPPRTNDGRIMTGINLFSNLIRFSIVFAVADSGCLIRAYRVIDETVRGLRQPMLFGEVPKIGTPASNASFGKFKGVCPPI